MFTEELACEYSRVSSLLAALPRNVSSGGERRDAGGKMSLAGRVRERRRPYLKATGELHGHSIAHELLIRKTFFLRSPFGYGGLNLC